MIILSRIVLVVALLLFWIVWFYYFLFVVRRWPSNLLLSNVEQDLPITKSTLSASTSSSSLLFSSLDSILTDGSRPQFRFDCDNISLIDVNLSSAPFAQGNEKAVWIGNFTVKTTSSSSSSGVSMRVALKRPYKILEEQTKNEVLRRFRTERDLMNQLQHDGIVTQLGGCYSSLDKLVSVVEYVTPFKRLTDDYFAQQPKRAIALYVQLLDLLHYLGLFFFLQLRFLFYF